MASNNRVGTGCCHSYEDTFAFDCDFCNASIHVKCFLERIDDEGYCKNCLKQPHSIDWVTACMNAYEEAERWMTLLDVQLAALLGQGHFDKEAVMDLMSQKRELLLFQQKIVPELKRGPAVFMLGVVQATVALMANQNSWYISLPIFRFFFFSKLITTRKIYFKIFD